MGRLGLNGWMVPVENLVELEDGVVWGLVD